MNAEMIRQTISDKVNGLQSKMGESFLEIMVNTITVMDEHSEEIDTFYGFEYSLSRSRHWDVQQENHIMFDGFTDEHIDKLMEDVYDLDRPAYSLIMDFEGMSDLDEAFHDSLTLDCDEIDD